MFKNLRPIIKFKTRLKKEHPIIREYYVSNNQIQGIYFIMKNNSKKEIFTKFLEKDKINNQFIWRRTGNIFKQTFQSVGIEMGDENKLLIERGELIITKKNIFGQTKTKKHKAERSIFIIRPLDFD